MHDIAIYTVAVEYTDYLRRFDKRVPMEHTGALQRPYIGVLLSVNGISYFAPMSSPKLKHRKLRGIDVYRIDDGRLGIVNLNNMLPVPEACIRLVDIAHEADGKYKALLEKQLRLLRADKEKLFKKARKLYNLRIKGHLPESMNDRCCDFALLEQKLPEYQQGQHQSAMR